MRKRTKRGIQPRNTKIDFPEIREKRPSFRVELSLVIFGTWVSETCAILTAEHGGQVIAWILTILR